MFLSIKRLRQRTFLNLFTEHWPKPGLSFVSTSIIALVLISILAAILETEPEIASKYTRYFHVFNTAALWLFTVEYIARLWSAGELDEYKGSKGRFRYIITPMAIIDLLTILPLWLGAGPEMVLVRLMRIARIMKLARIPGLSKALGHVITAINLRKFELIISLGLALFFMLISATVMYFLERNAQPEAFGSIPRALWWGMATLTTVGYGDVYPLTVVGKIFAGIFAISGIGLAAMPAGIFAAALSSTYQAENSEEGD